MLTQEALKHYLRYDPDTGLFRWNVMNSRRAPAGAIAGAVRREGYRLISINKKLYYAHRLAWLYVTGAFPEHSVDHINGVPGDDRWLNLREATHAENCSNQRLNSTNTSGVKGVSFDKRDQRWVAYINKNGRRQSLGGFATRDEAAAARAKAAKEMHGQFNRTGTEGER